MLSMPSGEELLIDYGSAAKGMYRFARTYGFIHFSYRDHDKSGTNSAGNTNDEQHGTSNRSNFEPGATSSRDSLHLELPAPSPPLIVPVRLADVATAPKVAVAGKAAGAAVEATGTSVRGAAAQVGSRAAAAVNACEERLRRYPTSSEEDLRLLRRPNSKACVVSEEGGKGSEDERREPRHAGMAKSAASTAASGAVTAEWVEMCIFLRAAEKIALERELSGREPPLD